MSQEFADFGKESDRGSRHLVITHDRLSASIRSTLPRKRERVAICFAPLPESKSRLPHSGG